MMALDENQNSTSNVRFVTKHAILTNAVGVHNLSLMQDVAEGLGVHHRNVLVAISRGINIVK
jgi:hypothetical protein